jgi:transposase
MKDSTTMTIGCDIGDRYSVLCIVDAKAEVVGRDRITTTKSGFELFFARVEPALVVIEAGTHSPWISVLLKALGHKVIVANPRKVRLIGENQSKSDPVDAELLARLGRVDPKLLSPIQHRSEGARKDLAVIRVRSGLVDCRTQLINHARGLVKSFGERLQKCSPESFAKKARICLPKELQATLAPVLDTIDDLTKRLREIERTIEGEMAERHPEMNALQQVNGVGALTALTFMLTLEDPDRFKKSRKAGAYLGLRPGRRQSSGSDPEIHITKAGDVYLRSLLVNCAHYILGPYGKDSDLRRWGLKLAARGKKNAKKRAVVATARKLAVLLHRLWKTGEVYQPLGYGRKEIAA